jgi:hypothetical protein
MSQYTITKAHKSIIMQFCSLLELQKKYSSIQHDGATYFTARTITNILKEFFGDRIISTELWSTRSVEQTLPNLLCARARVS